MRISVNLSAENSIITTTYAHPGSEARAPFMSLDLSVPSGDCAVLMLPDAASTRAVASELHRCADRLEALEAEHRQQEAARAQAAKEAQQPAPADIVEEPLPRYVAPVDPARNIQF
jgi:hypothetical protein